MWDVFLVDGVEGLGEVAEVVTHLPVGDEADAVGIEVGEVLECTCFLDALQKVVVSELTDEMKDLGGQQVGYHLEIVQGGFHLLSFRPLSYQRSRSDIEVFVVSIGCLGCALLGIFCCECLTGFCKAVQVLGRRPFLHQSPLDSDREKHHDEEETDNGHT